MQTHRRASLVLSALLALGCGANAVDLGHGRDGQGWSDTDAQVADSSTPQTIYDSDLPIIGFALDGPTLYALVYQAPTFELISCPLERCRSQRTTLYSSPKMSDDYYLDNFVTDTALVVAGDRLFWFGAAGLVACPKTGCTEPQRVSSLGCNDCFAADTDTVYWLDGDQTVQRLKPNTDVPERVHGPIADLLIADHLVVGEDHLYISGSSADLTNIRRVRKDGTGSVELVVEDEAISSLSAVGDSIYYASEILPGRIVKCAPDDCARSAVTLTNQRWPMELRVAGDEAFWLAQTRTPDYPRNSDISTCRLPDCDPVEIRVANFALEQANNDPHLHPHFAIGQEWLIWLEGSLGQFGWSLRRVAR